MGKLKDFFNRGREPTQKRSETGFWVNSDEARDMLVPYGYKPLSQNAEVMNCADIIASLVSSMTIYLMQNQFDTNGTPIGDVRVKNGLSDLVDIYPNKFMTRKNFVYKIVQTQILEGNGNCVVYPEVANGIIDNLALWNMNSVSFNCTENNYTISKGGKQFSPDEVLHFVSIPSKDCPFVGEGYARILKETVETLVQANTTKKGFLKSEWKPSLIISVNSTNEEMQTEEGRKAIIKSYVGKNQAGEPWIIPADEMKVDQVKPLTLEDLAIQESITLDKKTIAAAFGIPPFLVGIGEFNKDAYNNFISRIIYSWALNIQQEMSRKILYSPTMYFKFNSRSLMQFDVVELSNVSANLVKMGSMSRNEQRNWFDLAPKDGLDEFVTLENYIPVGKLGEQNKLNGGD